MNRDAMQKQMEDVRSELNQLDLQREALETILRGYEAWFRANPENGSRPHRQFVLVTGRGGPMKGTISFRKAEVQVLQEARGESVQDVEIWRRMQVLGAKSDAKNPLGFVNLVARGLEKVEKVAAKTWRWVD